MIRKNISFIYTQRRKHVILTNASSPSSIFLNTLFKKNTSRGSDDSMENEEINQIPWGSRVYIDNGFSSM